MKNIIDIVEIRTCNKLLSKIRSEAISNKKYGWDLPLTEFAEVMLCLNPQAYGTRIESRISDMLGLLRSDNKDCGDKMTKDGEYIEWKGSFFTSSNINLNLLQIRLWQETSYIFYAFDMRNFDNITLQFFYLTKDQIELERAICGTTSSHGTKEANLNNSNIELTIRIEAEDKNYNRWVKSYGKSIDELKNKFKGNK